MSKGCIPYLAMLFVLFSTSILLANPFQEAVSVNTVSPSQTEIIFNLPEFELKEHIENDITFAKIEMEDAYPSADKGLPDMPHFSATFAIPIGSTPTFEEVTLSSPRYMQTLPIAPVQNYDALDYIFDIDSSFYQSKDPKTIYPQTSYFMTEVQTLREYQFVTVKIYPVRFRPTDGTLEIIDSFQFTINHQASSQTYTTRPTISRAFEKIYEHTFQNYDQVRSPNPQYQEQSILLIYGGNSSVHNSTFMGYLNGIVNLKKQKGFLVNAVTTQTTGTTTGNIKAYIQNQYDNSPNPPEWVILLGATSGSYPIPGYTPSFAGYSGDSDYAYTHLAGGDYLGDVFIGRIPVSEENHVNIYWQKIQRYELNTTNTVPSLYKKSLLVGHSGSSGISTYIVNRYIKSIILDYDATANIQELYYGNSQTENIKNYLNAGQNIFNFRGYMGMDYFNVNNLTNTNILTNCVILTCGTNPSTTTELIRWSYNNQPAGGILATGISTTGTETEYNNAENGAIFYSMYVMDAATMGEAVLYGKIYLYRVYPGNAHTNGIAHWTTLMGDPSLYVFKTAPKTFSTDLPTTIPAGTQSFRFVVTDDEGNTVPDAWVTISKADGTYMSKAISDAGGVAYLPLDHTQTGSLLFAISKPGFHVKRVVVTVTGNNAISVIDKMIYDPAPNGNNSQSINPGETINLSIKVKNFTSSTAANLTATISSESEYVTLTGATTATLGSIGAGLEALYNDAFTFAVSHQALDKELLPFTFLISDGSNSWTSHLLLQVYGIDLKVTGNSPANLNIGSPTNLTFTLKNVGTIPSGSLQARLIPRSVYLTTTNAIVNIPNMNSGSTTAQSSPFTVNVAASAIAGMKLDADLHIFNDSGFETYIPLKLPIGNKVVGDPTGPDDYGYVIYHSNDTDTMNRPVYNWINIASIGTNTGMQDISANQEEDKRTVILPFLARFYGELYDRITICSNGWLVFGETEQKDFRNLPLPGPIAPRALISPYWTDLVVGGSYGGGVYTYYDTTENAFIVQFDNVKWVTGYPGSSSINVSSNTVTFQVLIYDPMYNGTATGDSKIKMQYQTFFEGVSGDDDGPIQYITVGIQDHTSLTGLEYAFNNVYSAGSNTLGNGHALLITSLDVIPEGSPHLMLTQVINPDTGANTVDYGTEADLFITVRNVNPISASNVVFTLTTTSNDVELLVTEQTVGRITGETDYTLPSPFSLRVSSAVADQTHVPMSLIATSGDLTWRMNFYLIVNAPKLELVSMQLTNTAGTVVHYFSPGNSGIIHLNFKNTGHMISNSGTLFAASLDALLTLSNTEMAIPALNVNETISYLGNIQIANNAPASATYHATYLLTAGGQRLSGIVNIPVGQMNEGFETGDFSAFPWNVETVRPWTIVSTDPASGTYCAQSNTTTTHYQSSVMQITWPTSVAGQIRFDYKVSSESNYDYLKFYINGNQMGQWSGTSNTNWQTISYPVSASNSNTFKWEYYKDQSVDGGQDRAWVDNIMVPVSSGNTPNIPIARVSVEAIDFGEVHLFETVTASFTIANLGNVPLTGTITMPEYFTLDSGPAINIPSLSAKDYTVTFCREESGAYNGVIAITTNDPNLPSINIPVSANIEVVIEPYLILIEAVNPLTDTNIVDYDSQADIAITVRNIGTGDAENVIFTLATDSDDVLVDTAEVVVSLIEGESTYTLFEPFTVTVSDAIADQTEIPFTLTATVEDLSWEMEFSMVVNAPKLQMIGVVLRDSADQEVEYFNPGDEGDISISFKNIGHLVSPSGVASATSIYPYLSLVVSEMDTPVLEIDEDFSFTSALQIDSHVPLNTLLPIVFEYNAQNQILTETVNIAVGQIIEGFETGSLSAFAWHNVEVTRPWTVVTTSPFAGQYCAQASVLTAQNQTSTLQINWPTNSDGTIHFSYKVSSASIVDNGDRLKFYIGDTLIEQWSVIGAGAWQTVSFPVTASASNVFKWQYQQVSGGSGNNHIWLDNIIFPTPSGDSFSNVPVAVVSHSEIDFGEVDVNTEVSETFSLANMGSVGLLGTITLPTHFSLDSEPIVNIEPFSSGEYTVFFSSSESSEYEGLLVITTNDPLRPVINISVSAVTRPVSDSDLSAVPIVTALHTNYPNPFNPSTVIAFDMASQGQVSIDIYNIKGQLVKSVVNGIYEVGSHRVVWNGEDSAGRAVGSGVYFYRMRTVEYIKTMKMLLIK